MAVEVKMPQLGLTMEEGTVSKWVKQEGDAVKAVSAAHNIYLHKLSFHDLRLLIYYIYS